MQFFGRGLSRIIKSYNFIFFLSRFKNTIRKNKRGLELVTSLFSVSKYVHKFSFLKNLPPGQSWCSNSKWFLSYSENNICYFMWAILWHHNHSICQFPLSIWKHSRRKRRNTKTWIFCEQKELLRWNKNYFSRAFYQSNVISSGRNL